MWNKDKSIALSLFCVRLFAVIMVAAWFLSPSLLTRLIEFRESYLGGTLPYFLITTYSASVPAVFALWNLYGLLRSISAGFVFTDENVKRLCILSWCCIAAGLICMTSALYYLPYLVLAVAAAFVGLILRVVKNVVEQAVALKNENDFTI
ncbi:MAG: DUF2975 domain-containing protein [Pygmaiobacter sp.]